LGAVVVVTRRTVVVVTRRPLVVEVPVEVVADGTVVAVVVDEAVVVAVVVVPAASAGGGAAELHRPATPAARAKPVASFDHHDPVALSALFALPFATTGAQRGARRSVKPCPPHMTP
jgi:hypothetical protein